MARTSTEPSRRDRFLHLWAGPNLPALVITIIIAIMGSLFVLSYSLAMADPTPRDVPIGIVDDPATIAEVTSTLDSRYPGMFTVERFDSDRSAVDALDHQRIYAVGVRDSPTTATLTLSSASGDSIARAIEQTVPDQGQPRGVDVTVPHAPPRSDRGPSGRVIFYLAIAASIVGFVGAIQTRVNAQGLTLRGELTWDLIRSAVTALAVATVVGPIMRFETFPVLPVWLVLAATTFIGGMVYSFWRVTIGARWALLPTWLMFVVVSNPSSGAAVAPQLLPPFYEFMGRWLPIGATVRLLRDLAYFPDAVHPEPIVVLCIWLVVATTAFVVARIIVLGTGSSEPPKAPDPTPAIAEESA